ncbi:MAG: fibronectin type III domain-containing protein, partial [Firmicutes bacterium]|nr:fibronectin type III domain-containing protein [Bacillota bacterium]
LYIDITYELDGGTILSGANPTKILNPKQFTYLKFSTRPYKEGAWLSGLTREYGTNVYPCEDFPCGATSFSPIYEEGTSASETVSAGWSNGDWHTSTFRYVTNGGTINGVQDPIVEFDAARTPDEYAPAVRSDIDLSVVPVKSGSVFEGWYLDEELTQPISSYSELPYGSGTNIYRAYAKWKDGPQDISKTAKTVLSKTSYVYTGSAFKPAVTVTLGDKTLVKDTDYKVTYSSNKNVGTAKVTVQGIGKYTGTINLSFKITPKAISKAKVTLSYTAYTYNGKARKPSVTVKDGSKELIKDTDYTLSYASGRKDVGSYKITIKGKGNYSESTTKTFKINPKGTTLDSITAGKKTLTVNWIKQASKMSSARISGYKIQIATNSKFTKNAKTFTVTGYSKVSKKITELKAGTTYYVRVRTYKSISGTTYLSKWSAYKKKKTQ